MKALKKTASITKRIQVRRMRKNPSWDEAAYAAGSRSVGWFWPHPSEGEPPRDIQWIRRINSSWAKWFRKQGFKRVPQMTYPLACRRFIRGFCEAANISLNMNLLLPTTKTVSCIISAMDEGQTLQSQLNELGRLPFNEIIVVINGSTDNSFNIARNHTSLTTVVHFDSALGYDVGRAVGARVSQSEILLFLDGDMTIRVDRLLPFIYEIELGADVVLNPISSLMPVLNLRDSVSNIKEFLNICLGRTDLKTDSLTAVPHALSRNAIDKLGANVLSVPPVAHGRAVRLGLSVVSSPVVVDVISSNRVRKHNCGVGNSVEQLILGDHLEALQELMEHSGPRLDFPDKIRQRHFFEKGADENV